MMASIEQRFAAGIKLVVLSMAFFCGCHEREESGTLECVLESIIVDASNMEIVIGQHDGWTDSTSLILVTFHKKSIEIPFYANLEGLYKGIGVYFYQTNINGMGKKLEKVPNNISWRNYTPEEIGEDTILPPYDPISIHLEYNFMRNCIGFIVRGKGYIDESYLSKCRCWN